MMKDIQISRKARDRRRREMPSLRVKVASTDYAFEDAVYEELKKPFRRDSILTKTQEVMAVNHY